MHRSVKTLRRHPPHLMVEDRDAPGTCRICHITDDPTRPMNALHDAAAAAEYEDQIAAEAEARQQRDRDRTGER